MTARVKKAVASKQVKRGTAEASRMLKAAMAYASKGWRVLPLFEMHNGACACGDAKCEKPAKHPRVKNQDATADAEKVKAWWSKWPNANIGFWLEGSDLACLDIDIANGKGGDKTLLELLGGQRIPATLVCNTPSGGKHLYFRDRELLPNKSNALGVGLDIWRDRHYLILPPSNHKAGGQYAWDKPTRPVADWPDVLMPRKTSKARSTQVSAAPWDAHEETRVRHAMTFVEATDRDTWVHFGYIIARQYNWSDEGFDVFNEWAATASNYSEKGTRNIYFKDSKNPAPDQELTTAYIFKRAQENPKYVDLPWPMAPANEIMDAAEAGRATVDVTDTQLELVSYLVNVSESKFRYCAGLGWFRWNGKWWEGEATAAIHSTAAEVARQRAYLLRGKPRKAEKIASAGYVNSMVSFAENNPRLLISAQMFDADEWLLNTPAGAVDLRTRAMRPVTQADYCSRITACAPDFTADRSFFYSFLKSTTLGDQAVSDYLQAQLGYCCTGDTMLHYLFFWIGNGRNGKNTLADLVIRILDGYAGTAPSELLMKSKNDRHPTEVARLAGLRMVVSSEIEEDSYWNEQRIKSLTGDRFITARLMHQNFFEFKRTHKHVIYGNHPPMFKSVDTAIRERLHVVEFQANFSKTGDPDMPEKLWEHRGVVLAWLIEGAHKVYAAGKKIDRPVIAGDGESYADAYLSGQITVERWLDEKVEITKDPAHQLRASAFYGHYLTWFNKLATGSRQQPISETGFGLKMRGRVPKERRRDATWYVGVRWIEEAGNEPRP